MAWALGYVKGCAGCHNLSFPAGQKRHAENLSSPELQGKPCDKEGPHRMSVSDVAGVASLTNEVGKKLCMGTVHRTVGLLQV